MKKISATTLSIQKRVFWSLLLSILLLFGLYGYFVSKSITNVLLREEAEQEILAISSRISELEFTYIDKKDEINLQFAYDQGFTDVDNKKFVTRKSVLSKRLTLNNEI